ncbi:MAG TPA: ABC transporter ATP-binding protein [Dermacoccus sp.]|nr:ABC transporter ATP-binding protein [Dermacoccus sp.]
MNSSLAKAPSWISDLRYLIDTFPEGSRRKMVLYCILQFLISLFDLAGLAAVVPVMQVISGSSMDAGYVGILHEALGSPARPTFIFELCGFMVAAFALKGAFALAAARWTLGFVMRLQIRTASKLLRSYLDESYLVQRRRDVGAVVRTIGTSVGAAHAGVLGGVLSLFSQLLSVVFILVFLAVVAPGVTLGAFLYFGAVMLIVQRLLGQRNREAGRLAQETSATMSHAMLETIYGAREIRMHAAERQFVDDFTEKARMNGIASRDANFYAQAPKYLIEFATILGISLLLATAAGGGYSSVLPVLTLFVAAAVRLMPTIAGLSVTVGNIRYGQEGLHVTVAALKRHSENDTTLVPPVRESSDAAAPPELALTVEDVCFRYPDGAEDVLQNVSFRVPAGSSVAVCGQSGSGKTTLIDIVLGLIPPTHGVVRTQALDVVADRDRWLDDVAYVPQDVYLLAATLWQNVAFGIAEPDVDMAWVAQCLEMAQLSELVDRGPDGLAMLVGAHGTQLSGGQRQRVGIARALYRRPKILVLDEATSALDNETERRISAVLRELHGQVTTILVAHRLSTVRHVDELLYLENGHVVARGTFEEVRRQSAAFERLVQLGRLEVDAPEVEAP